MIGKTEIVNLEAFSLVGISARTINRDLQSKNDLTALWIKFMSENVLSQVDNRLSDDIYCIYTDYESDYTGYYTAFLGYKVDSTVQKPEGLQGIYIPASKYLEYTLSDKSHFNVLEAWQEIWNSDVDRKYTADFDLYMAEGKSKEDIVAKIYLAVN